MKNICGKRLSVVHPEHIPGFNNQRGLPDVLDGEDMTPVSD